MGTVYNYCDCKNKDPRPDEKFSTLNMKSNKLYFFRNNNSSIKTLNSSTKNTKDSVELNNAANIIIQKYKTYKKEKKEKKEKQLLKSKIQYDKNIRRKNSKEEKKNDEEISGSLFLSNNSSLKLIKDLNEKNFKYIGGRGLNNSKEGFGITIWNIYSIIQKKLDKIKLLIVFLNICFLYKKITLLFYNIQLLYNNIKLNQKIHIFLQY